MDIKRATRRSCNFDRAKVWCQGHVHILPRTEDERAYLAVTAMFGATFFVIFLHALITGVL